MKNITTITSTALLIAATNLSAQVGINTDTPKSTLDVVGKATDITSLDGITAPRLTGDQLRAKTYTSAQTGALVYVTVADTTPAGQTVNVTAVGYFYFDGAVWQKVTNGVAATEPWYNQATSAQATANTQDIYQTGKVSIGKNASNGLLSVYDPAATTNMVPFYLGYVSQTDNTKNPFLMAAGNLGTGSYSTLSIAGDQALVFSVDGDPTTYTRNSLELIPHVNGGGAAPFGFKITDQGMFSFNAQYPTETLDLANGTMRIRNLPVNGATNAIYTTPSGTASIPASTDITGLAKTQAFTATRTVVADANGVLGYTTGLPATGNIYTADGSLTGTRTLTNNGFGLTFLGTNQSTLFASTGGIRQNGIAGGKRADIVLTANDNNSDGVSSNMQLFQDPEGIAQITTGGDSRGINIGPTQTTLPAYLSFITSAGGSSVLGTEKMRIISSGNVGINTVSPTEKLDNNGITRLRNLPLNGATNAINTTSSGTASASQDQTFTATRTVVADANGVLGTVNYIPPVPVVLAGADGADATGSGSFTIESNNNNLTETTLTQRTITVTKKSLVTFSFSVGVSNIEKFGGGVLTDGLSKQIGSRLVFSAVPSGSSYAVGSTLIRSAVPFTTSGASSTVGYFYLNGTEMLVLDPGSYTVDLRGYVTAVDNVQGIRARYDGASDKLSIIAIPMQ